MTTSLKEEICFSTQTEKDPTLPLGLIEMIEYYVTNKKIRKEMLENVHYKNKTFLEFLVKMPYDADYLQTQFPFRMLAIARNKKRVKLVYDGRHSSLISKELPIKYFEFEKDGKCKINSVFNFPDLDESNFKNVEEQKPLWQLVGLLKAEPDPQNEQEMDDFLTRNSLKNTTNLFMLMN